MVQPNIAQDIDGKYRGRDNQIHQAEGFQITSGILALGYIFEQRIHYTH
jgi:hypothetical protein